MRSLRRHELRLVDEAVMHRSGPVHGVALS
jgi:hypothetical protein